MDGAKAGGIGNIEEDCVILKEAVDNLVKGYAA